MYSLSQKDIKWGDAEINPWKYLRGNFGSIYNAGGRMGALCGTVNATDFVIWLVNGNANIRDELQNFYQDTPLPSDDWDSVFGGALPVKTVARSVSCHISRSTWDYAYARLRETQEDPGTYDMTRCGRLHGDMAKKCVELLNAWKDGTIPGAYVIDDNYKACVDCHSTYVQEVAWLRNGKEDCTICHDTDPYHTGVPIFGPGKKGK